MNSIRLLSGRVPVTSLANLTADRYQFLSVNQAEPNLGNGYSSTDVLTLGTNGVRVWANALSVASVSASGNVTGNYILGNGAFLSGVITSVANINNGTSNVAIPVANGNITVSVDGISNVAVFTTSGIVLTGNVSANNAITAITANAASFTGGQLSVTGSVAAANAVITNIANAASFTGGQVSVSGNVTANSGSFTTVVNTASFTGGVVSVTGNVSANNGMFTTIVNVASHTGGLVSVTGNVAGNNAIITNIANAASFTGGLISITGNIQANNGMFTTIVNVASHTGGLVSVSGNVTSGNVLSGGLVSATGNVIAANVNTSIVSATGNLSAANVNTGIVSATGNISAANVSTGGSISATGNVNGGNLNSAGQICATGNINTSGYFIGTFAGSITGNLTVPGANTQVLFNNSGNAAASAGFTFNSATNVAIVTGTISSTGNVIAGNLTTGAKVSATGNITTGGYFLGDGGLLSNVTVAAGSQIVNGNSNVIVGPNTNVSVSVNGTANVAVFGITGVSLTGNVTANNGIFTTIVNTASHTGAVVSVSGNITGGNVSTAGNVNAGNVNSNIAGAIGSFTGNVTANNVIATTISNAASFTGGLLTVTGNVTGNSGTFTNVVNTASFTGGLISVSGGITGGALITAGNVTGANVNANTIVGTAMAVKSTGDLTLSPTGNVSVSGRWINNVAYPVQDEDAASKLYVDTVAQGLHVHAAANLATTNDLATWLGIPSGNVTYTQPGPQGVGATLTFVGNSLSRLDGNTVTANMRILVKNQSNAVTNGVYTTTTNLFVITRATDMDTNVELAGGDFLFVNSGTVNADTSWVQTTDNVVVGTSNIVFAQFSGAGSYTANTSAGLSLNGTVFNAKVDGNTNPTTAFDINGNIYVPPGAAFTTPNIGAATGASLSVTGNVTANNGIFTTVVNTASYTGTVVSVTGNVDAGNVNSGATVFASGNIRGANINTTGLISATGNVTGNYILGNGAFLSGVITSVANINNGTSNVTVVTSGGNVTVGIGGTGNVAVFATTGEYITGLLSVSGNITGGNISTAGNVSGANIVATTLSATGNVSGANVVATTLSATGNVVANNMIATTIVSAASHTGGLVSVSGNITGNYILGNGSQLTGVNASNIGTLTTLSVTGNATVGNLLTNGIVSASGNVTGGNLNAVGLSLSGNVVSVLNSSAAITTTANITGGNLTTGSQVSAAGNITGGNISTAGNVNGANVVATTVSATGNVAANNVIATTIVNAASHTGTIVSVTGNVAANNVIATTIVSAASHTGTVVSVTGNVTAGGGTFGSGNISTTGNVSGAYFLGNGAALTGISAAGGVATSVANGTSSISIPVASGNITMAVAGTSNVVVLASTGEYVTGLLSASGNVLSGGQISATGNLNGAGFVTSGAGGAISGTGNITGGNLLTGGLISATGNITGNQVFGLNFFMTPAAATYGKISDTSIEMATSADATPRMLFRVNGAAEKMRIDANGKVGINVIPAAGTDAKLQITGGTTNASNVATAYSTAAFNVTPKSTSGYSLSFGSGPTDRPYIQMSASGTAPNDILMNPYGGDVLFGAGISVTGQVIGATGVVANTVASQGFGLRVVAATTDANATIQFTNTAQNVQWATITSNAVNSLLLAATTTTATGSFVTPGTITVNSAAGATAIINGASNAVGNIGSASTYFNRLFAQATTALYADLAEMYTTDAAYAPGTVLVFGGTQEVTISTTDSSRRVAGVVSTNPAHIMNSGLAGEHTVAVALTGRVPTSVVGAVAKGDMMVSAGNGRARAEANPILGTVIGKALEDFNGTEGVIEIVVGRL